MSDKENRPNILDLLGKSKFGLDTRAEAQGSLAEMRKTEPTTQDIADFLEFAEPIPGVDPKQILRQHVAGSHVSMDHRTVARRLIDEETPLNTTEAMAARNSTRLARNTTTADDLAGSKDLAKEIFPDLEVPLERQFLKNDKKWNTGHFPVGTRVIAGIRPLELREYKVAYLVRNDVRSYVIETVEPHDKIEGITHNINIDHVQQILERGTGGVVVRHPLWQQIGRSKAAYSLNPSTVILQEAAMSLIQKVGRHSWLGYSGKELLDASQPTVTMDELKVMLSRDLRKGRNEYITGSPQALVETLLERQLIDGQIDSDRLTTLLNQRGVFYKKTLAGFAYYGANKKKLKRAMGQLFNKCKVRLKTVEKRLSVADENFQLDNPFAEDTPRSSTGQKYTTAPNRSVSQPTSLSHYDDHDDRRQADHDRRDWDRLIRDIRTQDFGRKK